MASKLLPVLFRTINVRHWDQLTVPPPGQALTGRGCQGDTLLTLAIKKGDAPLWVVNMLLDSRSVNMRDNHSRGDSPLSLAIVEKRWDIVDLLIRNGANLNDVNHSGNTPMILAIEHGAPAVVLKWLSSTKNVNFTHCSVLMCYCDSPLVCYIESCIMKSVMDAEVLQKLIPANELLIFTALIKMAAWCENNVINDKDVISTIIDKLVNAIRPQRTMKLKFAYESFLGMRGPFHVYLNNKGQCYFGIHGKVVLDTIQLIMQYTCASVQYQGVLLEDHDDSTIADTTVEDYISQINCRFMKLSQSIHSLQNLATWKIRSGISDVIKLGSQCNLGLPPLLHACVSMRPLAEDLQDLFLAHITESSSVSQANCAAGPVQAMVESSV